MRLLEKANIGYKTLAYTYDPNNLDVGKIAEENELDVRVIYKTLVGIGAQTGLFVAVIPGDKQMDRKALARITGNKKVSLLPIDQLEAKTGYIRGGCCPIGMKQALPVYIDISAQEREHIWVNAGQRGLLIGLHYTDLQQASQASLEPIAH